MQFEWDEAKSQSNKLKHGISFPEALPLFAEGIAGDLVADSALEARWMKVAKLDGKHWSALYTLRGEVVRIISVRRSRNSEVIKSG
jgi:uncharacterized DUF497 family protein